MNMAAVRSGRRLHCARVQTQAKGAHHLHHRDLQAFLEDLLRIRGAQLAADVRRMRHRAGEARRHEGRSIQARRKAGCAVFVPAGREPGQEVLLLGSAELAEAITLGEIVDAVERGYRFYSFGDAMAIL